MQVLLFILSLTFFEVFSSEDCSPKSVKFINFQRKPKRSKAFKVGAAVESYPGMRMKFYEWQVKDMSNDKVVQRVRAPMIVIYGYSFNYQDIFNKTYLLSCHVSHYEDMRLPFIASSTFQFIPDKMHIEIKGGSAVMYPVQPIFEIDAESLSKDLSFKKGEHSLRDNDIVWTIKPQIPGFVPPKSLKLKIPYPFLKENQTYHFTVTVTRTIIPSFIDVQKASQIVTIIPKGTPRIKIKCLRNCKNPHPGETTVFRAVCLKNCENTSYEWSTIPKIEKNKTDLINGYKEFVIEGGTFKPGDKVDVILKNGISVSSYSLVFEQKMTKGTCVIEPEKGISGITLFTINCISFLSTNNNLKYMIYQMDGEKGIMISDSSEEENNVYLSEGRPAKIVVEVQDDAYEQEKVELEVEVLPYPLKTPKDALIAIKNFTFDESSTSEKAENEVVQKVSCLLDAINAIDPITKEVKEDLHKHLAESLEKVGSHDFDSSLQMLSVLAKLQKFKTSTDTKTSRLVGKSLLKAAAVAHITAQKQNIPISLKKKLLKNLFSLSSKLLEEVPELKTVLETKIPAHDYDSYDEMTSSKLNLGDDLRELTNELFVSIQCMGITILDKSIPDQKPIIFQNDLMNLEIKRVNLTTLLGTQTISLTNNTENKVFVPKPLIKELQAKNYFIDYQFGILKKNPFYWHPNISTFNTDIVLFDFFRENLKINSMKNPFYVHLKVKSVPSKVIKGNISSGDVAAYRFEVQPGSLLIFVFKAPEESFMVTTAKCYCKKEDFANGIEIQSGANESERTLRVETLDNENIIYICIKKSGAKLEYEGNFATFSCLYWDLKDQNWNADGSHCTVQSASLEEGSSMVCKCTHSSFFTGQIFATPNEINLNIELDFYITVVRSWIVFALLMGVLLMWILFLIIARFLDRKFSKKNKIQILDDNVPGDCHIYALVVFTGVFIDAGTTADVAFQLIGERDKSRVHLIKCKGVRMLQRNSQDWFIINTPRFLGDLKVIRVWHNCKGSQPHWYCKRIIVQHLKSRAQYCFIVEKWFSLIWGNGKIYREILIKNETFMKSGKLLLSVNVETQFRDKYLWMSVFTRDSQSNFSSLERVGTLGCTFFLSMLASAMFYGIPKNVPSDSIDPKSSYFITYRDLIIFLESWLVAVPIGIIVVLIFRNSAPKIIVEK